MRPKILGRIFCAFLALRLKLTIFDHIIKNRKCKFHKKRSQPDLSYNRGRMDWVVPIRKKTPR